MYVDLIGEQPEQRDYVLLATCQRIEVYTQKNENPLADQGIPFRHIAGLTDVRKRLITIACGITSQILGEKNIWLQVRNASRALPDAHPLKSLFDEALGAARQIRTNTGFAAEMDYEDVSIHMLSNACPAELRGRLDLLIIGSGMLARSFLGKDVRTLYKDVYFITRSPKNLKKKLDDTLKKNVLRSEDVPQKVSRPFHCIIASNNLGKDGYSASLKDIITMELCLGVFDLSAVPIFQDYVQSVSYLDTYSDSYLSCVARANREMEPAAERVLSIIEKRVSEVMIA